MAARVSSIANCHDRFSLDAATDFLLGQSVNSLQEGANSFAKAFGEVQRMQGLIYYLRIRYAFIRPMTSNCSSLEINR